MAPTTTGAEPTAEAPSHTPLSAVAAAAAATATAAADDDEAGCADILVAGSVALDLSCDYTGGTDADPTPQLHTSNLASIVPTVGGVGHNVALAAHRISPSTKVRLCSLVGDDIAGATVLAAMRTNGLDTSGVRQLGPASGPSSEAARTAHYVAVNGADKNLMVAMADMAIFATPAHHHDGRAVTAAVQTAAPRWVVADANWSASGLHAWIGAARQHGAQVAFEPVSVAKSARLFAAAAGDDAGDGNKDGSQDGHRTRRPLGVFPAPLVDLASPNQYELAAMHDAARRRGYVLDDARWFRVIDALGLAAGARARFDRLASPALADAGVPQQALQLLPYIPTLVTKLGPRGALLTRLLARDDPLLRDPDAEPYLLVRAPPLRPAVPGLDPDADPNDREPAVGAVYMRLFPPAACVDPADVVSVNGVGDTFLGALVAGLAQGGRVEQLVDVAQRAALRTLRSREAVAPDLAALAAALTAAAAPPPAPVVVKRQQR